MSRFTDDENALGEALVRLGEETEGRYAYFLVDDLVRETGWDEERVRRVMASLKEKVPGLIGDADYEGDA